MSRHRSTWRLAILALVALALAVIPATLDGAFAAAEPADESSAEGPAALATGEWTVIRDAISEQLAALRSGDASRAFSFASAGIREQFYDAPTFLRMVQGSYAALLEARYTEFLEGAVIDGHTIQPLRLILRDDTVLVALYEMQRDEQGGWRIAGCVIAPSTVRST